MLNKELLTQKQAQILFGAITVILLGYAGVQYLSANALDREAKAIRAASAKERQAVTEEQSKSRDADASRAFSAYMSDNFRDVNWFRNVEEMSVNKTTAFVKTNFDLTHSREWRAVGAGAEGFLRSNRDHHGVSKIVVVGKGGMILFER